jgi:ABC-type branched-subunit amino acid transport system substrate-binding protein
MTATAMGKGLKVGVLMGFTGGLAALAPAIETGALLAVDQANAAGGILGGKVEAVSRDTGTNPSVGRDAAAKLVEVDRVPAIVGALSSGVTTAVSSVTVANQVVLISPSSTSPALTSLDDKDYFFRTCPSDALQGKIQAQLALNLGYKTVGQIYVNNPYGKGLADNFKAAYEAGGGKVTEDVPYEENKPSYRGEVEKALSGNPDALNVIAYPADGNKQLVSAVEQGYKGSYLFPDGMKSTDVAAGPAKDQVNGSFGTAPGSKDTPAGRAFEKGFADFVKRTGNKADAAAPYRKEAYDAMAVIILAAAAAGPNLAKMAPKEQGKAIRDNIRKVTSPGGDVVGFNEFKKAFALLKQGRRINYNGVSGPVSFDKNGDIQEAVFDLWTIHNGKVDLIYVVD